MQFLVEKKTGKIVLHGNFDNYHNNKLKVVERDDIEIIRKGKYVTEYKPEKIEAK